MIRPIRALSPPERDATPIGMQPVNDQPTLGGTVRDRRLALGYSLGQLATKVRKTAASIRSWERGDTFPSEDDTAALANALDLDGELLSSLRSSGLAAAEAPEVPAAPEGGKVEDPWAEDESESPSGGDVPSDIEVAPSAGAVSADEKFVGEVAPVEEASSHETASEDGATDTPAPEVGEHAVEDAAMPADFEVEAPSAGNDADTDTTGSEALADTVAQLGAAGVEDGPEAGDGGDPGPLAALAMHEAMTEAVPVVPSGGVAVASGAHRDLRAVSAEPYAPPIATNPVIQAWDQVVELYRRIFDPRRRWIYRVRFVLVLIALYIMLRILGWAVSELWDALGEVLDGISFSPTDTPDVAN